MGQCSKYVLSASHSFADKQGEQPPNPSHEDLVVALGVNDVKELSFFSVQKRGIEKVHINRKYEYPRAYWDIAIVQLDAPVNFTPNVYPICLPTKATAEIDTMKGVSAKLAGYGPKTDESTKINQLSQKIKRHS